MCGGSTTKLHVRPLFGLTKFVKGTICVTITFYIHTSNITHHAHTKYTVHPLNCKRTADEARILLYIISPRKTLSFAGVPQTQHSFGDIRSDAVDTGDHHAPAESCPLRRPTNFAGPTRFPPCTRSSAPLAVFYLPYYGECMYESLLFALITGSVLWNGLLYGIKNRLLNMTYQNTSARWWQSARRTRRFRPGRLRRARHPDCYWRLWPRRPATARRRRWFRFCNLSSSAMLYVDDCRPNSGRVHCPDVDYHFVDNIAVEVATMTTKILRWPTTCSSPSSSNGGLTRLTRLIRLEWY